MTKVQFHWKQSSQEVRKTCHIVIYAYATATGTICPWTLTKMKFSLFRLPPEPFDFVDFISGGGRVNCGESALELNHILFCGS